MKRIPTLDGWRGIAIAMVILDHFAGQYVPGGMPTGLHGVDIFFVLSGFLITTNLTAAPIDLKKFYIRRFFRLMPVAWTYLGSLLVVGFVMGYRLTSWADLRACLLFYRNYAMFTGYGTTLHFWSLSVEEQFYLVWPTLLFLLGARRCRVVACVLAVSVAGFRWWNWQHYRNLPFNYRTEVRADALLVGCLLALYLSDSANRDRAARLSKWLALPALAGLIYAILRYRNLPPLWESVCIAILLAATMLHPGRAASRLLCWKPLAWLGIISYSVYIWQMPFAWLSANVSMLLLMGGVFMPMFAACSHYLIERPCIRLGHRLTSTKKASLSPEIPDVPCTSPSLTA
ncbi:MAG TPA: acyltransferase [Terracidiphilus sp.]|nr:acyltransferase [Terracidiphilus sp.]